MNENTVLYKAIEQSVIMPCAEEMKSLPDEDCNFSERYRKKMRRLIRDERKPYYPLIKTTFRKAVCIIAAIMVVGSATVAAVPPLREWFVGLFVTEEEGHVDLSALKGEIPADELPEKFDCKAPTFIPEGFEEINREQDNCAFYIYYSSVDGKFVEYSQHNLTFGISINTKDMTTEHIEINGNDAYISFNEEIATLVWEDEYYVYSISGNLYKDDIIAVANSLDPTK